MPSPAPVTGAEVQADTYLPRDYHPPSGHPFLVQASRSQDEGGSPMPSPLQSQASQGQYVVDGHPIGNWPVQKGLGGPQEIQSCSEVVHILKGRGRFH